MVFYALFEVGVRCDGITVDHSLEIAPQPNTARIQVEVSRRPCCWKLPADDFVFEEMAVEQLVHATGDVRRCSILRKHYGCITLPCLKSQNNGLL